MKGIPNRQKTSVQPREFKFIQRIQPGMAGKMKHRSKRHDRFRKAKK